MAATDYALVLAAIHQGHAWGTATTYADLQRTWTSASGIPSQASMDTDWTNTVEPDLALINDRPTGKELQDVALGIITGGAADTIKTRLADAEAAKIRIP